MSGQGGAKDRTRPPDEAPRRRSSPKVFTVPTAPPEGRARELMESRGTYEGAARGGGERFVATIDKLCV